MVNWALLERIAAPILALFIGGWVNRWFESRAVLLSHWGHVSSFNYKMDDDSTIPVNTHSVVIRNAGRQPATNVRLSHNYLPDFKIFPPVQCHLEDVLNSGQDIVIPKIVPNQQLTISYLYFPPTTFVDVNAGVKCDEGFATVIPVLLQRQYPRWLNYMATTLMIVGLLALVYIVFELVRFFMTN